MTETLRKDGRGNIDVSEPMDGMVIQKYNGYRGRRVTSLQSRTGYKFWICTIKNCFSSCRNLVNITIEYVSSIADAYRELLVLLVIVELAQEDEELLLVAAKDGLDLRGLLGVRDKDLEDMERLELDVAALVAEHVHHHLQVRLVRDVARHDVEIGAVKQDLAQQLERLPLRDVVRRQEECGER